MALEQVASSIRTVIIGGERVLPQIAALDDLIGATRPIDQPPMGQQTVVRSPGRI